MVLITDVWYLLQMYGTHYAITAPQGVQGREQGPHLGVDSSSVDSLGQQPQPDSCAKHDAGRTVVEDPVQYGGTQQHGHHHGSCYAVVTQRQEEEQGGQPGEAGSQEDSSLLWQPCSITQPF